MKSWKPVCLSVLLLTFSTSVLADTISIDYANGSLGGYTSDPNTPNYGWTYPHAGMGTATRTASSIDLATDPTNAEVGALYLDTGLHTIAQTVSLSFDLDVKSQAASGYGQTKTVGGVSTPILGGVRIFTDNGIVATSFQFAPTSSNGGLFGFRDANNTSLTTFGTYIVNTVNHVQIDANYDTGSADVYLNGTLALGGYQFWAAGHANTTTSEIFTYLNGTTAGTSNEILLGDALPPAVTPLPSSIGMGLALFGIAAVVARKKILA
jgi:hypothetical protein